MKKSVLSIFCTVLFVVSLVAAGDAAIFQVSAQEYLFSPQDISVNAGDIITWTNNGAAAHNVTSGTNCIPDGLFSSGSISPGQSVSFSFNNPGTFRYFSDLDCALYGMTGTVTVSPIVLPAPAGQTGFDYIVEADPAVDTDLSRARPLGTGPAAEGGDPLNVQLNLPQFAAPVDVHIAFILPTSPDTIITLAPDGSIKSFSIQELQQAIAAGQLPAEMTPWMSDATAPINATLFPNVPVSALPPGLYQAFVLLTLPDSLANSYLFATAFKIGVPISLALSGSEEVPPVDTAATGRADLAVNSGTGAISGIVTFSGLSSNSTGAHIHIGAAGVNGPIIIPLAGELGATSGVLSVPEGTVLTQEQLDGLVNNQLYVNVHSTNFPGGEIRAQLNFPAIEMKTALSGAREVPPVPTTGTGISNISVNSATGEISGTVSFSGLTSNTVGAHIHRGRPGENGPILIPLTGGENATSGTWTVPPGSILSSSQIASGLYVNIHTLNFPEGEIRGDLFMPPGSSGLLGTPETPETPGVE